MGLDYRSSWKRAATGRPEQVTAPLGGSVVREATSVGVIYLGTKSSEAEFMQ